MHIAADKQAYVFDLDGTLADMTHRLKYIKDVEKPNWDAFFLACTKDKPIWHMIQVAMALANAGYEILIVSGRSDMVREETYEWLKKYGIVFDRLYMRKEGDHRPDDMVKADILKMIHEEGFEIQMAFDDRDRVVKMWRDNYIPCAQVAEGDF